MLYHSNHISCVILICTLIINQFRPSHAQAYTNVVSGSHMQAHGCLRKLWINSFNFAIVFDKNRVYGAEQVNKTVTPKNSIVQIRALKQGQVAIRGVHSGTYLCVGKRNKFTVQAKLDETKCLFHEWIDQFGKFYFYRTYNSTDISDPYPRTVIKRKYLTFNQKGFAVRKGKPKLGSSFELVNVPSDEHDSGCQPQWEADQQNTTPQTNSLESRLLKKKKLLRGG